MFKRLQRDREPDLQPDADLERAARSGGEEAISVLYRRHGALIYRFSLRMCQDPSIAEEVTQEVFLALLRQADRYDPARAALSTWLCGIARRQVWKHLERRQRDYPIESTDQDGESYEVESLNDSPADALSRKESVDLVRRGLDELPADLKEVILLCEFEEMTYEEAALVVAVPVGTIRSRLHRAKARLKLALIGTPACTAPACSVKEKH
jgi:RNA polymerase sigma-70 factor, ECF subfamily